MRIHSLAFVLCAAASPVAFAAGLEGCSLRDATSPDASTVFLLCENGAGLKSRDAAAWEIIRTPSDGALRALHFVDANLGFLAGDSGMVLGTQDSGKTWRRIETGEHERFTSVQAAGANVWVAGYNGIILHSGDGGRNWQRQRTLTTQMIERLFFLDEARGWAVGWSGLVLRTVDGGGTWQQIEIPGVWMTLSSVHFRDAQNGWAAGMGGILLRSRDGGVTWERQPVPTRSWLLSLSFSPDGTGWIAAEYDLLRSLDGGSSWLAIPVEVPMAVTRVVATGQTVVAVASGFVLVTSGDEGAWRKLEVARLLSSATGERSEAHGAQIAGRRRPGILDNEFCDPCEPNATATLSDAGSPLFSEMRRIIPTSPWPRPSVGSIVTVYSAER